MKKINKLIAGVASAAMIVTAFSACGSASSSGKKLDFITGMATGSVHLKTLQSITDEFEKANPGVEINLIPASQDFTNDIKVRLAAKNAPDLWNTHGWSRDRYAKFLEPLQNRSWASKMKPITKEAFMETTVLSTLFRLIFRSPACCTTRTFLTRWALIRTS